MHMLRAGSNVHLLLKNYGSSEPKPTAKVTEITEGEEAQAETAAEEAQGATSEIIPLATRTKEGMAALVKVLKGLPGRAYVQPSPALEHTMLFTRHQAEILQSCLHETSHAGIAGHGTSS